MKLGAFASVASFVSGVIIVTAVFYRPNDALSLARFTQWTNVFFVWPALRAASLHAYSETCVFGVTLLVSALHHGCVLSPVIRVGVAKDTYILLSVAFGVLSVGTALAFSWFPTSTPTRRASVRGASVRVESVSVASVRFASVRFASVRRAPVRFAIVAVIAVFLAVTILLGLSLQAVANTHLDGCGYFHDDPAYELSVVPRLVAIWSTTDFVTAFAALIVVTVYFFQTARRVELGIFWIFVVVTLIGTQFVHASLCSQSTFFSAVAVLALVFVVARISLWCCIDRPEDARRALARYQPFDVVAGVLVGATAIFIFVAHNAPDSHGWWHILAAAALYLIVESNYAPTQTKEVIL